MPNPFKQQLPGHSQCPSSPTDWQKEGERAKKMAGLPKLVAPESLNVQEESGVLYCLFIGNNPAQGKGMARGMSSPDSL